MTDFQSTIRASVLTDNSTMPAAGSGIPAASDSLNVPWDDVVRFVRQLSHDLRNQLNAAELQSAYVAELVSDAETKAEIKRLREMMSELGTILQRLTASLGQVKLNTMSYGATDFLEDVQARLATDFPNQPATVNWDVQVQSVNFEIDPQLLQLTLLELFANAFRHEPTGDALKVTARTEDNFFVFRLSEPKKRFDLTLENWGREPLRKIGQSHYGLGLNRVRVIIEAHGGKFGAQYDPATSTLITTIALPVSGMQS